MSKSLYKKNVRRKVRRQENDFAADAPSRDKTLGRACRRGYGLGKAKV